VGMKEQLQAATARALADLAVPAEMIEAAFLRAPVEHSKRLGVDYQTAVCLVIGRQVGIDPAKLAAGVMRVLRWA
jgi:hypothetical protein